MSDRQLVLHIGAGKCGSSALQAALSRSPDLTAADGTRYRYRVAAGGAGHYDLLGGAALTRAAAASAYGYAAFPAVPGAAPEAYARALARAHGEGRAEGFVPVLSNEGWIGQAPFMARTLAAMGHPPTLALAFLRAPVDWLNAAFWQWGVWSQPRFERWYGGARSPYGLAEQLAAWAAIPNLQLQVFSGRADVVAALAGHLGVAPGGAAAGAGTGMGAGMGAVNRSSPPALIGFLLRNRQFRPDAHSPGAEFVAGRWCPAPAPDHPLARKPWAVRAPDIEALRPLAQATTAALQRLLPPLQRARLFTADPRWTGERPYHAEILARPTPLHRLDELPALMDSLAAGARAAAAAAGLPAPGLPDPPPPGADHAAWDARLTRTFETLLALDAQVRAGAGPAMS
jgi:hypothetical protein